MHFAQDFRRKILLAVTLFLAAGVIFWSQREALFGARKTFHIFREIEFIPGRQQEVFVAPTSVTVAGNTIYVADMKRNEVIKMGDSFDIAQIFARKGQGPGEVLGPSGIRIVGDRIFIADAGNMRIQVLDMEGKYLRSFKVQMFPTVSFAVDSQKQIYISMPSSGRIVSVFDEKGKLIESFGSTLPGTPIQNHVHLEIDESDNIYVIFHSRPIIRKYDRERRLIWERDISDIPHVRRRLNAIEKDERKAGAHSLVFLTSYFDGQIYLLISGVSQKEYDGVLFYKIRSSDGENSSEVLVRANDIIGVRSIAFDKNGRLYLADAFNGKIYVARSQDNG
jgi:DNA-binding beta-propeller fold protein YncE